MIAQARVLPDAESLVVQYLKDDPAVTAIVAGRVSGDLPVKTDLPALTVLLTGGRPVFEPHLAAATVQIDAWGTNREETRTLARTAQAALVVMNGVYAGGVVTGVETLIGVRRMAEPIENRSHYMFEARVFCHPLP